MHTNESPDLKEIREMHKECLNTLDAFLRKIPTLQTMPEKTAKLLESSARARCNAYLGMATSSSTASTDRIMSATSTSPEVSTILESLKSEIRAVDIMFPGPDLKVIKEGLKGELAGTKDLLNHK